MRVQSSATPLQRRAIPAWGWGAAGVVAFSLSFPATKAALPAFGPVLTGLGRAVVAAAIAGVALIVTRAPIPTRSQWRRLAIVSACVVVGFPLLSAVALDHVSTAHVAIIAGLMPAATAVAAVAKGDERPSRGFWIAALAGLVAVLVFAAVRGAGRPTPSDLIMLVAIAIVGVGYAEGGALSRTMPGWQVIGWSIVLAAPVLLPVSVYTVLTHPPQNPGLSAWLGFAYVSTFSMFIGFVWWYRGLGMGGVARIGQLQLAQPVLTLGWAALLLGERIDALTAVAAVVVLAATGATQRTR
ncbi:MAG: DMT family transporter, partial [Mycobacteriales bacterium]